MSEAKKAVILVLVFILAVGGFYYYKITSINSDIDLAQEEIKKEQKYIDLIKKQLKETERQPGQEDIADFHGKLPNAKGLPQLLQDFHDLSKENDIDILSLTAEVKNNEKKEQKDNKQEGNIYQTIILNLTVKGEHYNNLRSFFNNIYRADRLINLTEFNLTTGNDGKPVAELIYQVYYTPDMKQIIPDLEPIPDYPPSLRFDPLIIEEGEEGR